MGNGSLEVLSAEGRDAELWRAYLSDVPPENRDVFHLPEFAALCEVEFDEPALLFRYEVDDGGVLLVATKRSVADLPFWHANGDRPRRDYYDLSTPWGYGGPVVWGSAARNAQRFAGFRTALHEYCVANGIVAEFLRLHPLMENHQLFGADPGLYRKSSTVWVDLTPTEEEMLASMRKGHRRDIARARRMGVEVVRSDLREEHLSEFHRLYTGRMQSHGALDEFFLSFEFLKELAARLSNHVSLFLATASGRAIAGYLVLHERPYAHDFLAGSDPDYWHLTPNTAVAHAIGLWAKGEGYTHHHLGGGHGLQEDSLLHFKSGFSPNRAPYYLYRHVHDEAAYTRLCEMKRVYDEQSVVAESVPERPKDPLLLDYFPAYRA